MSRVPKWAVVALAAAFPLAMNTFFRMEARGSDVLPSEVAGSFEASDFAWILVMVMSAGTGAIILVNRPRHLVGRTLAANGIGGGTALAAMCMAILLAESGHRSAAALAEGVGSGLITSTFVLLPASLLLFPTGRLPSKRWRPAALLLIVTAALGFLLGLVNLGFMGDTEDVWFAPSPLEAPFGSLADRLSGLGFLLLFATVPLSVLALGIRFRRSSGEERVQLKWVVVAAGFLVMVMALTAVTTGFATVSGLPEIMLTLGLMSIPLAMATAILKYRLYEIDVIVSKSVTYLGLGAVITGLYVVVVVGPLLLIDASDDGGPGLLLPIVATGVVAVVFEPVRVLMQRWANRLVYGDRASPHEVLSQVTARLADTRAGAEMADLARLLAEGTGADRAVVWLLSGGVFVPDGVWSTENSVEIGPVRMDGFVDDEYSFSQRVVHRDEVFGAVSVVKPRTDPVTPGDRELVGDVAAGAGLLLRNMSLNRELEVRAVEVRESRRRLIAAQDAERHRLERDLHDGAQQQVVALKVKLGIARTIAEREGAEEIAARVSVLAEETQATVDALRVVAHGIYPPLLESEGLEAALRAAERASTIPVAIEASGLARYARVVEETVYFCVVETLERARMAGATNVNVGLTGRNGDLVTQIDAAGTTTKVDLSALSDRLDASDGTIVVTEQPDGVHHVTASLPAVSV